MPSDTLVVVSIYKPSLLYHTRDVHLLCPYDREHTIYQHIISPHEHANDKPDPPNNINLPNIHGMMASRIGLWRRYLLQECTDHLDGHIYSTVSSIDLRHDLHDK